MTNVGEGYQRVAALEDVPDGGKLAVALGERHVVLFRRGGSVHAIDDACPHAGAPLSEGFVEGERVTCAWHGWTFDFTTGRSTDSDDLDVACHPVRIVDGEVWVRA